MLAATTPDLRAFLITSSVILLVLALVRFIFEIIQLINSRLSYILNWENWVEILQYVTTIIFVFVYNTDCLCVLDWQWQIGVISVFLGWINLILFVSKLPFVGIYVIILLKISFTFFKMLILTVLLIISFAIPFFMVFFDVNAVVSCTTLLCLYFCSFVHSIKLYTYVLLHILVTAHFCSAHLFLMSPDRFLK